jgi:hypothetical protein
MAALPQPKLSPKRPPAISLFIFATFWSVIVGIFVCFWIYSFTNQLRTLSFRTADGIIDSIEKTVSTDSDNSTTYGIKVQYHYTVDGIRHSSDRLRFGAMSSSDNWADTILARFPKNSPVTVYYNPRQPDESVLLQGLESMDFFMLLFLTPFVLVGFFVWYMAFRSAGKSRKFRGLNVIDKGNLTFLRPSLTRPLVIAAAILGGGAFLSIFILGFAFAGRPPMAFVITILVLIVLATGVFGGLSAARILAGKRDLVIDDDSHQLRLPRGNVIPFADLTAIRIEENPNFRINDRPVRYVRIFYNANGTSAHHNVQWTSDPDRARQLAAYLALRLNLPASDLGQPLLPADAPKALNQP